MQRIARIYVDRFGSPTGWYEQTLFDLVDPDTGIPVDSIINLENAGGKTSLLSYIFSCFDPAMDRWLQTMQNKDHHFRDYFARDARPSFIIMEWVMPPRGPNMLEYRLVIGQAVAVKEAAERGADIDRRFFAFESMNGLCLEDIPAPGLALLPVQNMPDFVKWMQQGAKQSSGDFFYTSVQDDWTRHLGDRRLLDIELLRMQVAFNSKEGGNDDGFLVFSSEFELISRLLMLCLNIETAQAVRKSVAETIDRLKAKPKYEARLAQLLSLQQAMTPFSAAAAKYAVATANLKETNQEAANLYLALEVEAIAVKGRIDSGEAAIRALNESASTAEQNCLESRRTQVALMGLQHERKVETGKADFEEAERHVKAGHHRLICLRGAQAEAKVSEAQQRVADLENALEETREHLRPLQARAAMQGALLSYVLRTTIDSFEQRKVEVEGVERAAVEDFTAASLRQRQINDQKESLATDQGKLEGFVATAEQQRQRIIEQGLLTPTDFDTDAAIARLIDAEAEETATLAALKQQREALVAREQEKRQQAGQAALEADRAFSAQEKPRDYLAVGDLLRETLKNDQVLRSLVDADLCDPDSLTLLSELDQLIAKTRQAITEQDIQLAQLNRDRDSILETGLAGRSEDVDAVVRRLRELGVRSARATNTYVAELRPDGGEARALVISDPARFLGVNVAQGEWDKTCLLVADLNLRLSRPVAVAVATLEPTAATADCLVIGPHDDAAYNKASAQRVLEQFDRHIAKILEERDRYIARSRSAEDTQGNLVRYQTEYGAGRLRDAELELERLKAVEEVARERYAMRQAEADGIQQECKALTHQIEALPAIISKLATEISQLRIYQNDWEHKLSVKRRQLAEVKSKLKELEQTIQQLEQQLVEVGEKRDKAKIASVNLGRDIEALRNELLSVTHLDEAYPAEQELTNHPRRLEVLRSVYEDASSMLKVQEREQLGAMAERLDIYRSEAEKMAREFQAEFSGLNVDDIASLRGLDFEHERREQELRNIGLSRDHEQAREAHSTASAEMKAFWTNQPERISASGEMLAVDDEALQAWFNRMEVSIKARASARDEACRKAGEARERLQVDTSKLQMIQSTTTTVKAVFSIDDIVAQPILLGDDVPAIVAALMARRKDQDATLARVTGDARSAFRLMERAAQSPSFADAEPEISREIGKNDFERSCTDSPRIVEMVKDRLAAIEDTLSSMAPDFENCVGEIYNLASTGLGLINQTTEICMPPGTPYVGNQPILKMRFKPTAMSVDSRKDAIRLYLNRLIDTGHLPATGAAIVAECLLAFTNRNEFGLQILKMEQNTAYQYQPVNQMKKSGGQGTVIAMFLYMLVSQLRVDTQMQAKRGGGGPLILDNPFAKVQTRALIDAQRMLANHIGVQLVFLTANADANILAGFRRVIRLRKSGVNSKTNRSHIEMVKATFNDLISSEREAI